MLYKNLLAKLRKITEFQDVWRLYKCLPVAEA